MADKGDLLADSWKKTLARIPTVLGRLEYLSSLRNAHSGRYEHFGLAQKVGEEEADLLLRRSHSETFEEWLVLRQIDQKSEAEDYLSGLTGDKREIIASWLALKPFSAWVPAESRDIERDLFLADLSSVVESLRSDYQVASRDPEL